MGCGGLLVSHPVGDFVLAVEFDCGGCALDVVNFWTKSDAVSRSIPATSTVAIVGILAKTAGINWTRARVDPFFE